MPVNFTQFTNGQVANAATFNGPLNQLDTAIENIGNGSKPLATPDIVSFTNSQHTHLDAANGGTLTAAAIASGRLGGARIPFRGCMGRLGLTSITANANLLRDITSGTTLYLNPYPAGQIGLYDATVSDFILREFTEVGLNLSGLLWNAFYSIYAYWDGAAVQLEPEIWTGQLSGTIFSSSNDLRVITNASHGLTTGDIVTITGALGKTGLNGTWRVNVTGGTAFDCLNMDGTSGAPDANAYTANSATFRIRNTNAGLTRPTLTRVNGIPVRNADNTRRYIGAIQIDPVTGQLTDNLTRRSVSNFYNQLLRDIRITDNNGAVLHTYTGTTLRPWDDNFAVRVEVMWGGSEMIIPFDVDQTIEVQWTASNGVVTGNVGINSLTVGGLNGGAQSFANGSFSQIVANGSLRPILGHNFLQSLEQGATTSPNFSTVHLTGRIMN